MNRPRTSPLQPIPSRAAKSKHALKSRNSAYATRGADTIPGYVQAEFPTLPLPDKRAIANAIERYLKTPMGEEFGIPSPAMLHNPNGILAGLI